VDEFTVPGDEDDGPDQALLSQGTLDDRLDRGGQGKVGNGTVSGFLESRHDQGLAVGVEAATIKSLGLEKK